MDAWRRGLKCVSVYRDGCKADQPLSTSSDTHESGETGSEKEAVSPIVAPKRTHLPPVRNSTTRTVLINGATKMHLTEGFYPDGRLGEVFINVGKTGAFTDVLQGVGILISLCLQHGVPLTEISTALMGMNFLPNGYTTDEDIRLCSSVLDYLSKRLVLDIIPFDKRQEMGVLSNKEKAALAERRNPDDNDDIDGGNTVESSMPAVYGMSDMEESMDRPSCPTCGSPMTKSGVCWACDTCGSTTGCS